MSDMKLVQVDWVDSQSDGSWQYVAEARRAASEDPLLRCTSVGYVVADDDDYMLLAMGQSHPVGEAKPLVSNTIQIPRCSITAVRALSIGRRK